MMIKVPALRQPKKKPFCIPTCSQMIYEHYGRSRKLKEITKGLTMKKNGTTTPEIGRDFLHHNFNVALLGYRSEYWPKPSIARQWTKRKILIELRRAMKKFKSSRFFTKTLIEYLQEGGRLVIKIPEIKDLKSALKRGHPVIASIDRKPLYGKKPGFAGHAVVVTKIANGKVTINDPSPGKRGGVKTYAQDEFMYAIHSRKGFLLIAYPKK